MNYGSVSSVSFDQWTRFSPSLLASPANVGNQMEVIVINISGHVSKAGILLFTKTTLCLAKC